MGERTKIEWCDSTVNPTPCCMGCELYPDHCYAAALHRRYDGVNPGWPVAFTRPTLAFLDRIVEACRWPDLRWKPRKNKPWLNGMPRLIFVDDVGDPFAPFDDPWWNPKSHWLRGVLPAMAKAPHIWIILTKWPERFADFAASQPLPRNVWAGTSITSSDYFDRLEHLLRIDAAVRFISCEPAIGQIDLGLRNWMEKGRADRRIDWIIAGGETGPHSRPCIVDNLLRFVEDCSLVGAKCFIKQLGANPVLYDPDAGDYVYIGRGSGGLKDRTGSNPAEWPLGLNVRQMPEVA